MKGGDIYLDKFRFFISADWTLKSAVKGIHFPIYESTSIWNKIRKQFEDRKSLNIIKKIQI